MTWRPIDSAPKDNSKIDVWCVHPETGGLGVRFTDVFWRVSTAEWGFIADSKEAHFEPLEKDGPIFPAWKPVKWMPVPDRPDELEVDIAASVVDCKAALAWERQSRGRAEVRALMAEAKLAAAVEAENEACERVIKAMIVEENAEIDNALSQGRNHLFHKGAFEALLVASDHIRARRKTAPQATDKIIASAIAAEEAFTAMWHDAAKTAVKHMEDRKNETVEEADVTRSTTS